MRNGFKKWDRKITGYVTHVPSKWTKKELDSVEVFSIDLLESMATYRFDVSWHDIASGFNWRRTPQGWGYWHYLCERHDIEGPQPLPREAVEFCKELLAWKKGFF
jgi:hypothetical protein